MKIGRKDGELCVKEAHLPITIHTKIVDGIPAVSVKEHGEPEPEPYDDELGDSKMGDRLKYHFNMIRIHLESLDDDEIAEAWIKKSIRVLFKLMGMLIDGISVASKKEELLEKADEISNETIRCETKKRIEEIFE